MCSFSFYGLHYAVHVSDWLGLLYLILAESAMGEHRDWEKVVTVQPSDSCYRHQAMQKPLRGWLDASQPLRVLTDFAA
jgi:hypothetical protein